MTGVRGMAPCPRCGVLLDGGLVARIRGGDPEAFCPRGPRPGPVVKPEVSPVVLHRIGDLAALMILGAQMRAVHESGFEDDEELPEAA